MQPLAHQVGHPANREDVAAAIEGQTVAKVEPFAALDLGGDRLQRRIVGLEGVARTRGMCSSFHTQPFYRRRRGNSAG
jgi:hypothetical protein